MDAVLDSQHANALGVRKEMIHYGMTKTAQLAVSRGVAESVAGTGVTVNAVLPGPTRSEILRSIDDRRCPLDLGNESVVHPDQG